MTKPRFTTLLDWVEGRLSPDRARRVEEQLEHDADARETVEWIREFHRAAGAGLLEEPPADVRASLRAAFSRVQSTEAPDHVADVTLDSRERRVGGLRAAAVDGTDLEHAVVTHGHTRIVLSLLRRDDGDVDVHGQVETDVDASVLPPPGEVVLTAPDGSRRVAHAGLDGSFELSAVSQTVTEIWFVGAHERFRSALSLRLP